jgi:serine/threonine-protein kinase RsbT
MKTAESGAGLSCDKKLSDEFHLETRLGEGTTVTIRKWKFA